MKDEDLRNRIAAADSGADLNLDQTIVAKAALGKKRAPIGFRAMRLVVAAGASVLVAALALPQALAPKPLFSLAGSGGEKATSMAATEEVSADAATSMIWPGWFEYTYVSEGLSTEGGRGTVYEVKRVGNPEQILRQVAKVFGISGDVKQDEWSTPEYPSYSISNEETSLNIYWSGPGGWYFSNWSGGFAYGCAEPAPADDDTEMRDEGYVCEEPKPSGLVPDEATLRAQAIDIFGQLGVEVVESELRVYRDDWGASVSMPYLLNGEAISLESYIGWGYDGKVSYASGYSIEIVSRGEFDTISPADTLARISDWRWYGSAPSRYYDNFYRTATDVAVAAEEPAVVDEAGTSEQDDSALVDEGTSSEGEDPKIAPQPEQVEPEIVEVKVNRSEAALLSVWDGSGNMWLVPGYLLFNDQGWFDTIISLVEGVIELPEPMEVMPLEDSVLRED